VRAHRHDQGMTIEQLARASGVSVRTIISMEHEATNPRFDVVQKLANALGLTLSDLANGIAA
jgi:transcriptional regulator with XRE-family HTH domain